MLTKTLIGVATAIAIGLGSLTATTSTASATNYYSGWNWGWQGGSNWNRHHHKPKKVCKPVYRKIKWRDYWGHAHWKTIKVGYKCEWVYPRKKRRHGNWNHAY
jgi:hypothetical protein